MKNRWDYDGSIYKFPIEAGQVWSCQYGTLMVNDLYLGLPDFMLSADCVFSDPPWNKGNENSFRTKADLEHSETSFADFMKALFIRIDAISPKTCYIEMGKQNLSIAKDLLTARFPEISVFNSTYYHSAKNPCFILRGGMEKSSLDLEGLDEEDAIAAICAKEKYDIIADICMGRGAVGYNAFINKRRFVGTELNPKRLAVLINKIHKVGGDWYKDGIRYEPQSGE
jgi:hypothetical protein